MNFAAVIIGGIHKVLNNIHDAPITFRCAVQLVTSCAICNNPLTVKIDQRGINGADGMDEITRTTDFDFGKSPFSIERHMGHHLSG